MAQGQKKIGIVGAGLSGAVIARELAEAGFERRGGRLFAKPEALQAMRV